MGQCAKHSEENSAPAGAVSAVIAFVAHYKDAGRRSKEASIRHGSNYRGDDPTAGLSDEGDFGTVHSHVARLCLHLALYRLLLTYSISSTSLCLAGVFGEA